MKLDHSGLVLGGFLVASFTAAAIGGTATGRAVRDWYPALTKPAWNPPAWLFGPVWTVLPYLAWVSFAAFLNFTIWRLNP